jgi:hypothetical protein
MRRVARLAVLVLLAAGCGSAANTSGSSNTAVSQSHTVLGVSKAFYDAGIPFTTQTTFNPYVNGQAVFLPGKLNTGPLRSTVQSQLSEAGSFNGAVAWVFDTDAHAASALKAVPLKKWLASDPPIVRVHDGNVVVIASGFKGADKKKLDTALAALVH